MSIYQSMQRVRFSSTDDYEKFKIVFADVRHHLKSLPGFLHLTWWTHPQDPTWHNEVAATKKPFRVSSICAPSRPSDSSQSDYLPNLGVHDPVAARPEKFEMQVELVRHRVAAFTENVVDVMRVIGDPMQECRETRL